MFEILLHLAIHKALNKPTIGPSFKPHRPIEARLAGLVTIFLLIIPISAVITLVMTLFLIKAVSAKVLLIEFLIALGIALIGILTIRGIFRLTRTTANSTNFGLDLMEKEDLLANKLRVSLVCALLGCLGVTSFMFCPLAILFASQAISIVEKYKVGTEKRYWAIGICVTAIATLLFYEIILAGAVLLIFILTPWLN